jgi:hypothetical protein
MQISYFLILQQDWGNEKTLGLGSALKRGCVSAFMLYVRGKSNNNSIDFSSFSQNFLNNHIKYIVNVYVLSVKITAILIQKKLQSVSISVIFAILVGSAIIPYGSVAFAQQSQNTTKPLANITSNTNTTGATTNKTALLKPGNIALNTAALDVRMLQLTFSNKPKDIAALAYIWGYPLVTVAGSYAYYTTKGVPNLGEGPVNTINFALAVKY